MMHKFHIGVANGVGINAAIIFQNISFWISFNKQSNKNFREGRYWMYNSVREFAEIHPYFSEKQIKCALQKLVSADFLVKGRFNKKGFDKTNWYAMGANGQAILDRPLQSDRKDCGARPIPDHITNKNFRFRKRNEPTDEKNTVPSRSKDVWRERLEVFAGNRDIWPPDWGPLPGEPGCEVPEFLIKEILPDLSK